MIKLKEIVSVLLVTIVFAFSVSFRKIFEKGLTLDFFLLVSIMGFIILCIQIFTKKIIAFYYNAETEEKIFQWQRYWFYERSYLKHPLPAGILFPFIIATLTQGYVYLLTLLQFDVSPKMSKVAKSKGLYRYSEMTDIEIGKIAAGGIIALLIAIIIAYILPFSQSHLFAKLCIFYVFWNMLPLSHLDGNKIFFGSRVLWTILAAITLIFLGYALFPL